ncbi:MAG: MFS transporter [Eubacterium sp.]|nr:MFS transporter [Eubacterium sp.]
MAGCIFCIVAIWGAAIDNVYYVAAMRGIGGFMMGVTNVVAVAILTDAFIDEGKRAKMIGLYNTIMPITGSILSAIAGVLALKGWENVFNVYWMAVPMVIFIILFVPKNISNNQGDDVSSTRTTENLKESLGSPFWVVMISFAFLVLGCMALQFFTSVYIAEHNLGDVAYVGLVTTIIGYGSVLTNAIFGFVYVKVKRKVLSLAYILPIVGSLMLMFIPNNIIVIIAYFLILAGYGFGFSSAYAYAPTLVTEHRVESAIGIATAAYSIATFFGTYFVTICMDLLNTDSFTKVIPVITVIFIILLIVEVVIPKKYKEV